MLINYITMKDCNINFVVFAAFVCIACLSCSGDDPDIPVVNPDEPDPEVVEKVLNNATTEWGLSRDAVKAHMHGYNQVSLTDNNILQFQAGITKQSISYIFKNDKLCGTAILIPTTSANIDLQSLIKGYSFVGEMKNGEVYVNQSANTMATVWQPAEEDSAYSAVGFAPIKSDAFETIIPIEIETGEAQSVEAKRASVYGMLTGVDNDVEVGIIYGLENDLNEFSENKQSTRSKSGFTVTLTDLYSETTYYYRAYAIIDDMHYLGEVKSFTTAGYKNSFNFNGKQYNLILVEGCSTGDFYIMDKEIPGTAFDRNGDGVVSYNECSGSIEKLQEQTGLPLRTPYFNEWQYAAKGGNKSNGFKYSGSDTLEEVGWYSGNSNHEPHPSGEKKPNELGIFDMSGNWAEICLKGSYAGYDNNLWYHYVCGGSCDNSSNKCQVTSYQVPPYTGNWNSCFHVFDPSKDYGHIGIRLVYTKGH